MAYILYGQSTVGGKQVAEAMDDLLKTADKLRDLTAWVLQIGAPAIETNTDFSVGTGEGQGFSDTLAQINAEHDHVHGDEPRENLAPGEGRMTVGAIHLHALPLAWPALWPFLEPAAHLVDMTEKYVRRVVESGHGQLWAIVEDDKPVAAVVTQVTLEPVKRCLIWIVGGSRVREWMGTFMPKIEAYAREWGCVALWGAGRKGWARIVEPAGFVRIADTDGLATWEKGL